MVSLVSVSIQVSSSYYALAGSRWFRAFSITVPPVSLIPTSSSSDVNQAIRICSSLDIAAYPVHKVALFLSSCEEKRWAMAINLSPELKPFSKKNTVLVPYSWNKKAWKQGQNIHLVQESGETMTHAITGYFSDLPGLNDNLVLTNAHDQIKKISYIACIVSPEQIESTTRILKDHLPKIWNISSALTDPVHKEWFSSLLFDRWLMQNFIMFLSFLGSCALSVCTGLILSHKRKEIALMRSMGASVWLLGSSFLFWASICCCIGQCLGGSISILIKSFVWSNNLELPEAISYTLPILPRISLAMSEWLRELRYTFICCGVGITLPLVQLFRSPIEMFFRTE